MIRAAVARGWGAAVAKACKQPFPDCERCRRPESTELRVLWGCDAEADRDVWESSCPACLGSDHECSTCGGTGDAAHRRCPTAIIESASPRTQAQISLLFRAYAHYDKRNVLPAHGAWLDQTRSFFSGVDLIDSERAYWEAILHDHERREIERSRQSAKRAEQHR